MPIENLTSVVAEVSASAPLDPSSLRVIRSEFREMPGLVLSVEQGRRLWSLDAAIVERAFAELVAQGELRQFGDRRFVQRYVRADYGR
jgi:hypothetical protein